MNDCVRKTYFLETKVLITNIAAALSEIISRISLIFNPLLKLSAVFRSPHVLQIKCAIK